jgi:hypothetical protein
MIRSFSPRQTKIGIFPPFSTAKPGWRLVPRHSWKKDTHAGSGRQSGSFLPHAHPRESPIFYKGVHKHPENIQNYETKIPPGPFARGEWASGGIAHRGGFDG